jgi:hypothetical protein
MLIDVKIEINDQVTDQMRRLKIWVFVQSLTKFELCSSRKIPCILLSYYATYKPSLIYIIYSLGVQKIKVSVTIRPLSFDNKDKR